MRMSNTESGSSSRLDDHVGNLTAVDAISERLAEVTRLAEKLDERLYEAGARIRNASRQIGDRVNGNSTSSSLSLKCEQVSEVSSEFKKSLCFDQDGESIEKNTDNDIDESCTEDFVTATECTTTPMARSRSESFATMSEGDEALHSSELRNIRQDAAQETRLKKQEFGALNNLGDYQEQEKQILSSGLLAMAEMKREDGLSEPADVERTSSTSIIERVEEKCGKIVKEVTETTTLRVSHDTRFGVASYKLTSNTLREAHEHTDFAGILDMKGFGVKTNGHGDNNLSDKDESTNEREEISISEVKPILDEDLESSQHSKFSKIIRESSQKESKSSDNLNENNNVIKTLSYCLESRGNNDSGIEMTPGKNGDYLENNEELEDLELLTKLKTVSRSQVVVDYDATITMPENDSLTRRSLHVA